jgi:copper(I)-binding protein
VHNDGKAPLRLVSATSDAFGMVELHKSLIVNGVSTMRPAGEQIIPAGGTLKIAPGGLHWMLMQPKRALKIGDSVHLRLGFADGSSTNVDATVAASEPR